MEKHMPPPPPPGFVPSPPPGFVPSPPPYPSEQPNVVIVGAPQFGSESQRVTCPHCHANITTQIETESNMKTHMVALIFCLVGLWCCSPCPYCMDSCLIKKHYCPACKQYLGESTN